MNANELRIGNYALGPLGEIAIIDVIGNLNYPEYIHGSYKSESGTFSGQNGFSGIPLTHEILEKCGFYWNDPFYEIKNPSAAGLLKISYSEEDGYVYDFMTKLNYLHQLQNLYFALTGEELPVKIG